MWPTASPQIADNRALGTLLEASGQRGRLEIAHAEWLRRIDPSIHRTMYAIVFKRRAISPPGSDCGRAIGLTVEMQAAYFFSLLSDPAVVAIDFFLLGLRARRHLGL
jgi:hypothetical protein